MINFIKKFFKKTDDKNSLKVVIKNYNEIPKIRIATRTETGSYGFVIFSGIPEEKEFYLELDRRFNHHLLVTAYNPDGSSFSYSTVITPETKKISI